MPLQRWSFLFRIRYRCTAQELQLTGCVATQICSHALHIALRKEVLLKWGKVTHLLFFCFTCLKRTTDWGCGVLTERRDVWKSQTRLFHSYRAQSALTCRGRSTWRETGHRPTTTQIRGKSWWKHPSPPWSRIRVRLLWQHSFSLPCFPQRL